MSGDRSLDEFAAEAQESSKGESEGSGDDDSVSEADSATDNHGESGDEQREPAVDPAESTYAWSPSGATCAACGATVERRWRDEGDLVCADCKSW